MAVNLIRTFWIFGILCLTPLTSHCLELVTGGRLIVNVANTAPFSAFEFSKTTEAYHLEIDERNPFLAFENIYSTNSFIVIQSSLEPYLLKYLGRRYGYRFISFKEEPLSEAVAKAKEVRRNIPQYSSQIPHLTEEELLLFYRLLQTVDEILTQNNIKFWASRKALLGAVRFQEIIPWDDDLSLCIFDRDESEFLKLEKVFDEVGIGLYYDQKKEFYKIYDKAGTLIKKGEDSYHSFRYPSIDIFVMSLEKTCESQDVYVHQSFDFYKFYPLDRFKFSDLEPLKRVSFGPVMIPVPNNPEKNLNSLFGRENFPKLWEKYTQEPTWNHKQELTVSEGSTFLEIDHKTQ